MLLLETREQEHKRYEMEEWKNETTIYVEEMLSCNAIKSHSMLAVRIHTEM